MSLPTKIVNRTEKLIFIREKEKVRVVATQVTGIKGDKGDKGDSGNGAGSVEWSSTNW